MLKRIFDFITDKENILYAVFGVLATFVNWAIFLPLSELWASASFGDTMADAIAWFISMLFAFMTNKIFVFRSRNWSPRISIPELIKFSGSRLFSFLLELAIVALMADLLGSLGALWKLVASVITMIINYISSKKFIFNKKEQ